MPTTIASKLPAVRLQWMRFLYSTWWAGPTLHYCGSMFATLDVVGKAYPTLKTRRCYLRCCMCLPDLSP